MVCARRCCRGCGSRDEKHRPTRSLPPGICTPIKRRAVKRQHTVRSCGSRREEVPGRERSRETPCKGPEAGEGTALRLSILKAAWSHAGGWAAPPPLLSAGAPLTAPHCGSAWPACLALPLPQPLVLGPSAFQDGCPLVRFSLAPCLGLARTHTWPLHDSMADERTCGRWAGPGPAHRGPASGQWRPGPQRSSSPPRAGGNQHTL